MYRRQKGTNVDEFEKDIAADAVDPVSEFRVMMRLAAQRLRLLPTGKGLGKDLVMIADMLESAERIIGSAVQEAAIWKEVAYSKGITCQEQEQI
jgi:hypothetical protein